jgi:acyl-CoA reductase-like NAD-dependent aldehyde dehydrogenase
VRDDDEAVARANASPYGLNASVWTADPARGRRVAARIRCGTVNVNEGFGATFGSIDAPMGGMKQSGLGRRNGPEGILRFVEARTIAESTGVMTLPRTGAEFAKMTGLMTTLLVALKTLRRR